MKVPVYDQPQAEARADVPAGVNLVEPNNEALQRGIERGADALGKGIDQAQQQYEKFKHEARSADVANGLAAYANDATDAFHGAPSDPSTEVVAGGTPALQATPDAINAAGSADRTVQLPGIANPVADTGFLGTRGKAAATAEPPLLKNLAQRRDQIAAGFKDPDTKKLFLERVQQYDIELRAKAASHVGQQVAVEQQDAANNISDAALRAAAADPSDDKLAAHLFGEAAGAVHALGATEEFKALHERQLRAEMAGTRINSLLAPGPQQDVAKAREVLEANRGVLGENLRPLDTRVTGLELSVAASATANGIVDQAVKAANGPFAEPDPAVAEKLLAQLPADVRKRADPLVKEALVMLKTSADERRKVFIRAAVTSFNKDAGGFFRSDLANQLNEVDPDKYAELVDKADIRYRRAKTSKAEQNKEQRETNAHALEVFMRQGSDENGAPDAVDSFLTNFKGDVDNIGRLELQKAADRARKVVDAGQVTTEATFAAETVAQAKGWRPTNPKQVSAWRDKVHGDAVNAFSTWIEDHEGKPPTKDEAAKIRAGIIGEYFRSSITAGGKVTDEQAQAAGGAAAIAGGGSRQPPRPGKATPAAAPAPGKPNMIRVRNKKTGAVGNLPAANFNPDKYETI